MKQKDYMKKLLKQVSREGEVLCDDCGKITKISHAIVDHHDDSVKVVCDSCFMTKYKRFI